MNIFLCSVKEYVAFLYTMMVSMLKDNLSSTKHMITKLATFCKFLSNSVAAVPFFPHTQPHLSATEKFQTHIETPFPSCEHLHMPESYSLGNVYSSSSLWGCFFTNFSV